MNVQFSNNAVQSAAHAPNARRCLFLLTPTGEECGVESFARLLVERMQAAYPDAGYDLLPVSPRWRDLPATLREVSRADSVVFNVPLTAWKKLLFLPLAILLFARFRRRNVRVFVHEWAALHWLRRIMLAPLVLFSQTIIVVSPLISDEVAHTWWLPGVRKKFRLVPNAPTVSPREAKVTERVERVREAAEKCDIVIGHFGALYKGKASTALLDVCDYLRRQNIRALILFVGSFPPSLDGYEVQFWAKVAEYGIADQVIVTGYVTDEAELYTLFNEADAFLFLFPEGLTARRSSVIHTLQSNRPVVVTAPRSMSEFAHHKGFTSVIESGVLSFITDHADLPEIADKLLAAAKRGERKTPAFDGDAWWAATTAAADRILMTDHRGSAASQVAAHDVNGLHATLPSFAAAKIKKVIRDGLSQVLLIPALPFLRFVAPRRADLLAVRPLLDRAGVTVVANHYHEPVFTAEQIFRDPQAPRALVGIDWNIEGQKQLLRQFNYERDLRALEGRPCGGRTFHYTNGYCGPGDAEALYSMIRHFRPSKIVEIGSGQSTIVSRLAIDDAKAADSGYHCQQICFEPYENPWLEGLGIEIRRELIERSDLNLFKSLAPNDIVFIDSSHALRPMGDVEFEFLHVLPNLPKGVIVQVHDIFSPRDYPAQWLTVDRRFWNEQYLLEAFLSFNDTYEIIGSLNQLMHLDIDEFKRAFPILAERGPDPFVGSFWFRRVKD
jgi:glycosyltransferase involved in cell wall biosynthesis